MTVNRLADYLDHMRQAIADAQWGQVLPLAYLTSVRLRGWHVRYRTDHSLYAACNGFLGARHVTTRDSQ